MFTSFSRRKVWWLCEQGHEWQAVIQSRTGTRGRGCPYCAGRYPSKQYNLAVKYPELAKQWHSSQNGRLTPFDVTPGSHKKVWWICSNKHEWQAVIKNRVSGSGCPFCSRKRASPDYNLAVKFSALSEEWHPTKNGPLTPSDVTPGSAKQVWWQCKNHHEWQTAVTNRTRGNNCPYCSGRYPSKDNNLAVLHPSIAKAWHPTQNKALTPYDVVPGSHKRVWWICDKGHEWQAVVRNRVRGSKCRQCN